MLNTLVDLTTGVFAAVITYYLHEIFTGTGMWDLPSGYLGFGFVLSGFGFFYWLGRFHEMGRRGHARSRRFQRMVG